MLMDWISETYMPGGKQDLSCLAHDELRTDIE